MSELVVVLTVFTGIMICGMIGAYYLGKSVAKKGRLKLYNDLVTERAVRHNLNCLVGDLRHDLECMTKKRDRLGTILADDDSKLRQVRADAAAWNQCKGLWCTDKIDLIKHHARKELFFRLGYPEHKL